MIEIQLVLDCAAIFSASTTFVESSPPIKPSKQNAAPLDIHEYFPTKHDL